jgi:hypothetical protein
VFLKQNDGLIEIYYLNKTDKTNCCVFGCNRWRKNEPEACFYLFSRGGVKANRYFCIIGVKEAILARGGIITTRPEGPRDYTTPKGQNGRSRPKSKHNFF